MAVSTASRLSLGRTKQRFPAHQPVVPHKQSLESHASSLSCSGDSRIGDYYWSILVPVQEMLVRELELLSVNHPPIGQSIKRRRRGIDWPMLGRVNLQVTWKFWFQIGDVLFESPDQNFNPATRQSWSSPLQTGTRRRRPCVS